MKKKVILIGTLVLGLFRAQAQSNDTAFKKNKIAKTEIEILYNHYAQDGKNSAVTGGIGTEKLTVYAPGFQIKNTRNNHQISFKGGADIISSASTDNIDFVMSSASSTDMRSYVNIGLGHNFEKKRMNVHGGMGISIESDYTSLPFQLGISKRDKHQMRTYFFDVQMYFDDLRWGRLNEDLHRATRLIYPAELRTKEWYDTYKRQSYNFRFGLNQIVNKRNVLGIYPEFTYQTGLLSTPFHRVYFKDASLRVENLPSERFKGILGIKLNSFVGGRIILKNKLDAYADNFGIVGLAIENETAIKLTPLFVLTPMLRWSIQQGSKYFKPYGEHLSSEEFYTSDYDLSDIQTSQLGLGLHYIANKKLSQEMVFNDIRFQYAYYMRSNQLKAHLVSLVIKGIRFRPIGKSKGKT